MALIEKVSPGSIGEQAGITAGDRLLSINDLPVDDMLDYQFLTSDMEFTLLIEKADGDQWEIEIEKDFDEDLGLQFEGFVFDRMKRCRNKCVFCFIDQLPDNMRSTLYTKDDDYRYSFWYGNFITLTNLSEEDWQKIITMRLSPLYISVHSMDPAIRVEMMKNPAAADIKAQLQRLLAADIMIHTQIVLCPGINDGEILKNTIEELSSLYPGVQSIGIVPVGLTGHRHDLAPLRSFEQKELEEIIALVDGCQKRFREEFDWGLVYLADEFYLAAGQSLPEDYYYDDYSQIENGIGLSRILLDEFSELEGDLPRRSEPRQVYLLTGESAVPVMDVIRHRLNQIEGLAVEVLPVKNSYFGGGVSVTGLLTGSDIVEGLGRDYEGKNIIIPEVVFKDGQEVFLDNAGLSEIAAQTGANFLIVDGSARSLIEAVLKGEANG